MAGYSTTPLIRKLGIKPGIAAAFPGAPPGYATVLGDLPDGVRVKKRLAGVLDFIQVFCPSMALMCARVPRAVRTLDNNGMLWICWPKKASGVATDLGEADVRQFGLDQGLVDVKICAVDETWSGLKFVYRLKNRQ